MEAEMTEAVTPKTCFIACPIGAVDSEIWRRSDKVFRHIFQPALNEMGYEAVRSDKQPEPGIITTQIMDHILNAPLVIADLSGHNPNVFYELAVRHSFGLPVIQVADKGSSIPFDVKQIRTIFININDPDDVQESIAAIQGMVRTIESAEAGYQYGSPIRTTLDVQAMRQRGEIDMADLVEQVSMLSRQVSDITTRLDRPPDHFGYYVGNAGMGYSGSGSRHTHTVGGYFGGAVEPTLTTTPFLDHLVKKSREDEDED